MPNVQEASKLDEPPRTAEDFRELADFICAQARTDLYHPEEPVQILAQAARRTADYVCGYASSMTGLTDRTSREIVFTLWGVLSLLGRNWDGRPGYNEGWRS